MEKQKKNRTKNATRRVTLFRLPSSEAARQFDGQCPKCLFSGFVFVFVSFFFVLLLLCLVIKAKKKVVFVFSFFFLAVAVKST